jgi:hypothetical protein
MNLPVHFAHLLSTYAVARERGEIDLKTHEVLAKGVRDMAMGLGVANAMVDATIELASKPKSLWEEDA